MTNQELKEQFERCIVWNDQQQWEFLAIAYYQRGYDLNALYCFRKADALKQPQLAKQDADLRPMLGQKVGSMYHPETGEELEHVE